MTSEIGCVLVTYNRIEKLKKTLECYSTQTVPPKYILVVNNCSTDGIGEYLCQWEKISEGFKKLVIHTAENLGGSGGFYLGEERALHLDADWVMIADDDAYPEPNYLEGMQKYIDHHDFSKISIVCGKVAEHNHFDNIHRTVFRSKWDRNFHEAAPAGCYQKPEFNPDFVSYVGIVINKSKLEQVGLVNKEYFIWCDDTEHTYRLGTVGKIVCIPAYSIIHDVDISNDELSWKSYYGYRNDLMFFKQHFKMHFPAIVMKLFFKTLLCPLKGRSVAEMKLRLYAIKDAISGNMGKNIIYKPGWQPSSVK